MRLNLYKKTSTKNLKKQLSGYTTETEISAVLTKLTQQFGYLDTVSKSLKLLGGSGLASDLGSFSFGGSKSDKSDDSDSDSDDSDSKSDWL